MKKILLLFLLLILSCPCYANNSQQKEDEDFIREIINSPSARLSKHQLSLKQDYLKMEINKHYILKLRH